MKIKLIIILISLFLAFNTHADPFDAFKEIAKELDKSVNQKKEEIPKQETPKQETPKQETKKQETPKQETQKKPSDADALQVAYDKGMKFAKESGVKWQLYEKKDELSGVKSSTARLNFKSSGGAALTADLTCDEDHIFMNLTVTSGTVPTTSGKPPNFAFVRAKVNDNILQNFPFEQSNQYRNVLYQYVFKMRNGKPYTTQSQDISMENKESIPAYIYIADVPTNMGNIIIKVPPYDNAVYALGQTCK